MVATSVIRWATRKGAPQHSWLAQMMERKLPMVVAFTLANKMAGVSWEMLTRGEDSWAAVLVSAA